MGHVLRSRLRTSRPLVVISLAAIIVIVQLGLGVQLGRRYVERRHTDAELADMKHSAIWLVWRGRPKEAEEVFRQILKTEQRAFGADHPDALTTMDTLAWLLLEEDRCSEAEEMFRQVACTSSATMVIRGR